MFLVFGCSNDDFKLYENGLFQTQWNGLLQVGKNETKREYNLIISFETLSGGRYISDDLDVNANTVYSWNTTMEYEINGKIISIYGGFRNILEGAWWVVESKKEKLILKRKPYTKQEAILTLKKMKL